METYRYKNAVINVYGEVDREKIEKATIIFLKKVEASRKREKRNNGNRNTT